MTREEAKAEINKVFEPAFANYIITALTEGETPSECKTGKWTETGYVDGINVLDGKCSICGEWIDVKRKSVNGGLRYCPFCGIKMEVDDDTNDAK